MILRAPSLTVSPTGESPCFLHEARSFDAMNRYSLTERCRIFSEQMMRSSLSGRSSIATRIERVVFGFSASLNSLPGLGVQWAPAGTPFR